MKTYAQKVLMDIASDPEKTRRYLANLGELRYRTWFYIAISFVSGVIIGKVLL